MHTYIYTHSSSSSITAAPAIGLTQGGLVHRVLHPLQLSPVDQRVRHSTPARSRPHGSSLKLTQKMLLSAAVAATFVALCKYIFSPSVAELSWMIFNQLASTTVILDTSDHSSPSRHLRQKKQYPISKLSAFQNRNVQWIPRII